MHAQKGYTQSQLDNLEKNSRDDDKRWDQPLESWTYRKIIMSKGERGNTRKSSQETITGMSGGVELTEIGCPFFARCPLAIEGTCDTEAPPRRVDGDNHIIECHREVDELLGGG